MPHTIGERVGAILSADKEEVKLFGFGVYVGDEPLPKEVGGFNLGMERPNPKIVLDTGEIVWGCECWWGPEEKIKSTFGDRKIVQVNLTGRPKQS